MKKTLLLTTISLMSLISFSQKKTTTSAVINFDAATPLDSLPKAVNKTVVAALNLTNGEVAFEASVKNFSFSNPMMQDHFNGENWMNSEKFPKATFKGNIKNLDKINFTKAGKYIATIEGELNIKGNVKPVSTTAQINVVGKSIATSATFIISLADYGIELPKIAAGKVSENPSIKVTAKF
jgi:polyisoprenoid-binding protein YceI